MGVGTLSEDFQVQMMKLLNETFSKLSTAIGDNKYTDIKTDWPKFSGDSKKFRAWHLAIRGVRRLHEICMTREPTPLLRSSAFLMVLLTRTTNN
jgi:hypothetical protein